VRRHTLESGARVQRAISNASSTVWVRMGEATRQPTIMRLEASMMKHTYAIPDRRASVTDREDAAETPLSGEPPI
jgi:hypothetical protein